MRLKVYGVVVAAAVAAVALCWPTVARAQSAGCTVHDSQEARQQEARRLFGEGQRLAGEERFTEALAAYECSFQNVPHPSTLYNVARAAELTGDFRRALDAWRGYLRMNPEAEDRADIERRIAALEGTTGTGSGGAAPPPGGTGAGTAPTPTPAAPAMPPPAAAAAPQSWETPEGAPTDVYRPGQAGQEYQVVERRPPSPWRYYAWYIMGTGAVAAILGLYFMIPDGAYQLCGNQAYVDGDPSGDYDWMNDCAVTGYALLGVGGALMLSAAAIWLFSEPGGEYVVTRRAGIAPTLAFDERGRLTGASASWVMRF